MTGVSSGLEGRDYLTIKYDREGNERWRALHNTGHTIAVDSLGNAYVGGDQGVLRFDPNGVPLWTNFTRLTLRPPFTLASSVFPASCLRHRQQPNGVEASTHELRPAPTQILLNGYFPVATHGSPDHLGLQPMHLTRSNGLLFRIRWTFCHPHAQQRSQSAKCGSVIPPAGSVERAESNGEGVGRRDEHGFKAKFEDWWEGQERWRILHIRKPRYPDRFHRGSGLRRSACKARPDHWPCG